MLPKELMTSRSGNFTASENHRLMSGWNKTEPKRPELIALLNEFKSFKVKPKVGELKNYGIAVTGAQINDMWTWIQFHKIPQGLITYAKEKACEELFYHDPSLDFETVHTKNGEDREVECVDILSFNTDLDFIRTGEDQQHVSVDGVGATPDGVVVDKDGKVITGCEAKCKSPLEHAKSLLINNGDDMRKHLFDYYVQVQTHMLVFNTDHWYFANYNPFGKESRYTFKHIIVGRDNDFIEILKSRIEIAKKIKDDFSAEFKRLR